MAANNSNKNSNTPSTRTSPDTSIDDLKAHNDDAAAAAPSTAPRPSTAILKRPTVNPSGTKSSSAAPSSHSSRASSPSSTLPLRTSAPTSPSNATSGRPSLHMTPFSSTQPSPTATKSPPSEQQKQQADADRTPRASTASSVLKSDDPPHQQVHSPGIRSPVLGSRRNSANSMKLSDVETSDSNINSLTSRLLSFGGSAENSGSDEPASRKSGGHGANTAGKIPRGASGMAPRLETVQEGDHSTPPKDAPISTAVKSDAQLSTKPDTLQSKPQERANSDTTIAESSATKMTEDSSRRSEGQAAQESTKTTPRIPLRKASTSSLPQLKNRQQPNEGGSAKTMTVETETVTSIPQAPTATADRGASGRTETGGALRTKNSSDTIRPKKERKKPSRKPQLSGTGNTKADLFEAKVASAVDEGESDSDETFVYESNPLEPRHRHHTHHSRTPSTNSVRSFADRRGGVRPLSQLEPQRAVTGKRSMKFASSASYASSSMDDDENENEGGAGARSQHNNSNARRYRSLMEADSPFSNASRMHARDSEPKTGSRRGSPQASTPTGPRTPTRKMETTDFEGDRADDESAPLLGTVRQKPRYQPKRYTQLRHMDMYLDDSPKRTCSRCICCTIAILLGIVVVLGIVGFAILTTKPLQGVHVTQIRNVLASEQEIMFDLVVKGMNPNIITVTATNVDINIFARSRYVGSDKFWRDHGFPDPPENGGGSTPSNNKTTKALAMRKHRRRPIGLSPIERPDQHEDIDGEKATMLLGRVFEFDTGVEFTASPWQHRPSISVGEMRLAQPGNKTETGGTERWEAVLEHPFELIVRGIVYYQLPLTTSTLTASLGASVLVTPDSAGGRYTPVTDNEGNVLLGDGDEGWWP